MADQNTRTKNPPITQTIRVDTDLSAKQYHFVNYETTDEGVVNLAGGATLNLFILQEGIDGSSTEAPGTIAIDGGSFMKLGGTVNNGDKLTSDANGKAITTTTDTNHVGAIALADGVADDLIPVRVIQIMVAG